MKHLLEELYLMVVREKEDNIIIIISWRYSHQLFLLQVIFHNSGNESKHYTFRSIISIKWVQPEVYLPFFSEIPISSLQHKHLSFTSAWPFRNNALFPPHWAHYSSKNRENNLERVPCTLFHNSGFLLITSFQRNAGRALQL